MLPTSVLDAILNLLYDHIEKSGDSQARVKWAPGTVAIWDNRICTHVSNFLSQLAISLTFNMQTAILDFDLDPTARRHGVRITPQAERPVGA